MRKITTGAFLFLCHLLFLEILPKASSAQQGPVDQTTTTLNTKQNRTADSVKNEKLQEVLVTASRMPERIDEVPSSVTILGKEQIEQQININPSISEILAFTVPGLGPSTNKATNSGQTLRGRSVLVLIDGIPQSTPLMNGNRDIRSLDPAIIERVEVIKGATSIYGNGSGGGIINYITKKPDADKRIAGQTFLGLNGHPGSLNNSVGYRLSQSFSGTLDKFSYVASATYNYTGLLKAADGSVLGQEDGLGQSYALNTFAKGQYRFNKRSELTVAYSFFKSLQNSDYVVEPGVYGERPAIGVKGEDPGAPAGTPQNHNVFATYTLRDLPFHTEMDLTGYFHQFLSTNRYVAKANGWYGPGQTQISSKKKGLRLNLLTPFGNGRIKGTVAYGMDLLEDDTYQPLLDGRVYIPNMDMTNIAPYAQLKIDMFDHLIFKGGIRYENAQVDVKDYQTLPKDADGGGVVAVKGGRINYKSAMFNAGLRYNKYEYFNPFVSFSQAFGLNELGRILRAATVQDMALLQTDPIITNNYEAGFSSRFSIFNLTAAYYISTSKLGANLVANESGTLLPQRNPEKVHGYELTLDAQLAASLGLGATYAYVEGKAEKEDGTKEYLGFARIAPPKATAYARYRATDQLDLQLFWVYTGSRDRFDPQEDGRYRVGTGPVKSVSIFNLSGSYQLHKAVRVGFGVENIFNKSFYPFYSQYSADNLRYTMGNGARASLNLTYTY
ncbi:TonB-dependent receptor [Sphingobacterium sp. SGR-19]|uniref:TonB-dependent receptor n=1 Tax=Sphingobacterium sp. SGR-19 TaxID=2710886 RepID=UPI0013EB0B20|nr:TonB-dependent receptor [Sphingobacterium sp. SGR-19]NGM65385.1 TonB-dependent receptor [Sphingobacterium sp. SGR-19]